MARPFEKLPSGAKTHLEAMAATGLLSESAAATALGMPLDQFRKVISEHKPSKEVLDYVQSSAAVSRRSVQGFVVAAARNSRGRIERRL
jgi:hypothetical protein